MTRSATYQSSDALAEFPYVPNCTHAAPGLPASKMPSYTPVKGSGAMNRRRPVGGFANGIPRNCFTLEPGHNCPRTTPAGSCTTGCCVWSLDATPWNLSSANTITVEKIMLLELQLSTHQHYLGVAVDKSWATTFQLASLCSEKAASH